MADDFAELVLEGASVGIDHYEKVVDPFKKHAKRIVTGRSRRRNERNRSSSDEYDDDDDDDGRPLRRYDDRYTPSSRSDRRSGSGAPVRIVEEYERRRGRTLSTGGDPYYGGRPGPRYARNKDPYDSDSESSLSRSPPRRRRNPLGEHDRVVAGVAGAAGAAGAAALAARDLDSQREDLRRLRLSDDDYSRDSYSRDGYPNDNRSRAASTHRRRPAGTSDRGHNNLAVAPRYNNNSQNSNNQDNSTATASGSRGGGGSHSTRSASVSSQSTSTSDLCSSSEDERRIKKMRGKEYLSAGLAAVATIHAAKGLFSSLEARDKRYEELRKGEITREDAKRKKKKARLQDVAAIGIAALGIKGAYSEWQEVQETRHELRQQKEERKRRHEKRMRLRERAQSRGGGDDRYRRDDGRRDGYRSA